MQPIQPTQRHEIVLHMRRNERASEDRKLQLLKERLVSIGVKRVPDGRIPRDASASHQA